MLSIALPSFVLLDLASPSSFHSTSLAMYFCPNCSNLLLVQSDGAQQQLYCQTCPYIFPVVKTIVQRKKLDRKQVDDVLGGDEAWANVDQTEASCPRCEHDRAYYMQIQTRSADEPMTTFYKCCELSCGWQWKE